MNAGGYAVHGWRVFPCAGNKQPLIDGWPDRASRSSVKIERWWRRWPNALVGVPTGAANGFCVLDVDIKNPAADGRDSLDALDFSTLFITPIAHTRSGGFHIYFSLPEDGPRNTAGSRGRGIGAGLDWRGNGGYVVVPSPGSGYWWDPICGFATPLAAVPAGLLPHEPERVAGTPPIKPALGLTPYAEAALDDAARKIVAAPNGEQNDRLNAESFAIGTLAGAGAVPAGFARRALKWAACQIVSYDPRRPWRRRELEEIVDRAFDAGLRRPRGDNYASMGR